MDHDQVMFMFDNVAGWVDTYPPFSDYKYTVTAVSPAWSQSHTMPFETLEEVDAYLDYLGMVTDDRE